MNVSIDLGNTLIKIGIFDGDELRSKLILEKTEELKSYLQNFSSGNAIISSVNSDGEEVRSWASGFERLLLLKPGLPVPVQSLYQTPETLGVDRIAAVCGAIKLFPDCDCLVVNAGTCITYDLVDSKRAHHGGAISPGLQMRFKAMNTFTARLPLVQPSENPPLLGQTTTACMQSGVIWGMAAEIDGIVNRYREKFPELKVILTGGDGQFFENKLKASIFAGPELVLRGLNSILLYNISE